MKTLIITVLLISACNVQPEKIKVSEKSDSEKRQNLITKDMMLHSRGLENVQLYVKQNNKSKVDSTFKAMDSLRKELDSLQKL